MRLRKVKTQDELHEKIDDYQIQGYQLKEHSDKHAVLKKSSYGSSGMHVLWFFLTFWWTLGLGNLGYLIYSYTTNSEEIMIKRKINYKSEKSKKPENEVQRDGPSSDIQIENSDFIKNYRKEQEEKRQAGSVDGKHYTEYIETVKNLKREKKHKEAIELLLKIINAVEQEAKVYESFGSDGFCAPGWYKHLAIIYRKEKRYDDEVAILERLQNQNNYLNEDTKLRLEKAKELLSKNN